MTSAIDIASGPDCVMRDRERLQLIRDALATAPPSVDT